MSVDPAPDPPAPVIPAVNINPPTPQPSVILIDIRPASVATMEATPEENMAEENVSDEVVKEEQGIWVQALEFSYVKLIQLLFNRSVLGHIFQYGVEISGFSMK